MNLAIQTINKAEVQIMVDEMQGHPKTKKVTLVLEGIDEKGEPFTIDVGESTEVRAIYSILEGLNFNLREEEISQTGNVVKLKYKK